VPARPSVAKDILKDLDLPPDAPKFGELTPAKTVAQPKAQTPVKIQVPDLPRIPDIPERAVKMPQAPQRTSISEELDRELEEELKKVKEFTPAAKLEIPKEVKEAPAKPVPQQEAAIPQVKAPQTQLKTSGASGTNPFWGRVEAIIKSQWEPPPIDVSGTTYSTVIRFRFYRNGTVKDVGVQQSSGNPYFDDAGKRAILKPRQFPVFPADMTDAYQDVEMVFRVGESAG
jgi:TonB family protein